MRLKVYFCGLIIILNEGVKSSRYSNFFFYTKLEAGLLYRIKYTNFYANRITRVMPGVIYFNEYPQFYKFGSFFGRKPFRELGVLRAEMGPDAKSALFPRKHWSSVQARIRFHKNLRYIQKRVIGKMFIKLYGNTFPWQRILMQSWINVYLHRFLRFYKNQIKVLKIRGRYLENFNAVRPRLPEHSKWLWLVFKKYYRNKRWLYKKKFTVEQQYKYYKRMRFLYRSQKVKHHLGWAKPRSLIRKINLYYNFRRLTTKINELSWKIGDYPKLSNLLHKFQLKAKTLSASSQVFGRRIDFRAGYLCLFMRKKQNNYYLTVTDGLGQTKFFISSGSYLLKINEKKRNKKLRRSFRYFVEVLKHFVQKLKKNRVSKIKYFFRPLGLRRKFMYLVLNTFQEQSITIERILKGVTLKHRLKKKKKKIRRL